MRILVFYQGWCRWFEEDMDAEVVLHNGFQDIAQDSPHVSDSSQIVPFVRRGMFLVKCTHVDMAAVASTWYCMRPLMFVGFDSFTFARELLEGNKARENLRGVSCGGQRAKSTLMDSARGWWSSVRVSPKGGLDEVGTRRVKSTAA